MLVGRKHARQLTMTARIPHSVDRQAGALVTSSDSIEGDSRLPHPPIWVERRQTKQPGSRSANIPCFLVPDDFPYWIQPLAAASRNCGQELKTVYTWSEQLEGGMATSSLSSASLINSASFVIRQSQSAVSMSNLEVEKCR
jgi:hypothetical protein